MSEKLKVFGICGLELEGKIWKHGGSIKCQKRDLGFTRYPKPKHGVFELVRDLCADCVIAYQSPNQKVIE